MPPFRVRFLLGQLGPKPGAARQLDRCLTEADLDAFRGPYHRIDQRTWRTGASAVRAIDQHTTGGIARLLGYAVGADFVALVASGGTGQPWSWAEVAELGARQRAELG